MPVNACLEFVCKRLLERPQVREDFVVTSATFAPRAQTNPVTLGHFGFWSLLVTLGHSARRFVPVASLSLGNGLDASGSRVTEIDSRGRGRPQYKLLMLRLPLAAHRAQTDNKKR
eukprot:1195407-Prorocentrum_minimum.AAC.1